MPSSVLDITEQLYSAKIFIAIISFCNIVFSLLSAYTLLGRGMLLFSLLALIVFVFNTLFLYIAVKDWNRKKATGEIIINAKVKE